VHAPSEADLNLYAYVSGQALKAVDPLGLNREQVNAALQDQGAGQYAQGESGVVSLDAMAQQKAQAGLQLGQQQHESMQSFGITEGLQPAPSRAERSAAAAQGLAASGIDMARGALVAGAGILGPAGWLTAYMVNEGLTSVEPTKPTHPTLQADYERNYWGSSGVMAALPTPKLQLGGIRGAISSELGESLAGYEYFIHGTTAGVARNFELQAGRSLHTTTDPAVARLFAERTVAKAGGGEVGGIAVVLPRESVSHLRSLGQLTVRPISDMPQHLETVFAPGARETILKTGTIIPLPPGAF
jgi:hypothetical protein